MKTKKNGFWLIKVGRNNEKKHRKHVTHWVPPCIPEGFGKPIACG